MRDYRNDFPGAAKFLDAIYSAGMMCASEIEDSRGGGAPSYTGTITRYTGGRMSDDYAICELARFVSKYGSGDEIRPDITWISYAEFTTLLDTVKREGGCLLIGNPMYGAITVTDLDVPRTSKETYFYMGGDA